MKKILIIGADSLIGKGLYNLIKNSFITYGTSRRKKTKFYNLNLEWKLKKWPQLPVCDVIICCAAMTNIIECEEKKKLSKKVNIGGLKKIIKNYKKKNTQIIFFSSTCVFSGKKPYTNKKDLRKPLNIYGEQKKACEDLVLKNNGLVIRSSKIIETSSKLFKNWAKLVKKNKKINPYIGGNSSLIKLKNILDVVLYSINKNKKEILHVSGPDDISYLKMAKIILKKLNKTEKLIFSKPIPKKLKSNFSKFSTLKNSNEIKKITKIIKSEKVLKNYLKEII